MRKKQRKLERKGKCPVTWGTHGCHKQVGHVGNHYCANTCPRKPNDDDLEELEDLVKGLMLVAGITVMMLDPGIPEFIKNLGTVLHEGVDREDE